MHNYPELSSLHIGRLRTDPAHDQLQEEGNMGEMTRSLWYEFFFKHILIFFEMNSWYKQIHVCQIHAWTRCYNRGISLSSCCVFFSLRQSCPLFWGTLHRWPGGEMMQVRSRRIQKFVCSNTRHNRPYALINTGCGSYECYKIILKTDVSC